MNFFDLTPPWARRLEQAILSRIQQMENRMSDLTDAVDGLTTAVTSENAEIDTLVEKLATLPPTDPDVAPTVDRIKALTAGINDKLAQFNPPAPSSST